MVSSVLVSLVLAGQSAIRLEFKPPVGKSYHFVMKMDMQVVVPGMPAQRGMPAGGKTPLEMSMSVPMEMKIVKQGADGTTIASKMGHPTVSGPLAAAAQGQMGSMEGKSIQTVIDRHFQIKSLGAGSSPLSGAFGNFEFPAGPIHVGQAWTSSVDVSKLMPAMGGGGGKMPLKYKLVAIKHEGGETIAVLEIGLDGLMPMPGAAGGATMSMKGQGTASFDVATGMYRTSSMNVTAKGSAQGQNFNMVMTESLART